MIFSRRARLRKEQARLERFLTILLERHSKEMADKIRSHKITPSGDPTYDDGKDAGLDLAAELIEREWK